MGKRGHILRKRAGAGGRRLVWQGVPAEPAMPHAQSQFRTLGRLLILICALDASADQGAVQPLFCDGLGGSEVS
jgi:hypothetical protein